MLWKFVVLKEIFCLTLTITFASITVKKYIIIHEDILRQMSYYSCFSSSGDIIVVIILKLVSSYIYAYHKIVWKQILKKEICYTIFYSVFFLLCNLLQMHSWHNSDIQTKRKNQTKKKSNKDLKHNVYVQTMCRQQ